MALVNMKQGPEEAQEDSNPTAADQPQYPYGLEIRLDEDALAKLGITSPPAVGTEMMITCKVVVTSASSYQSQGGEQETSSCWQITDMEVSTAPQSGNAAATLYAKTT